MISCQTCPKNEAEKVRTDVIFPTFPYEEDGVVYPTHYDEYGNDLVEYGDTTVTLPKWVWDLYNSFKEELIMSIHYFKNITKYVIDTEAAIERLKIYEEGEYE